MKPFLRQVAERYFDSADLSSTMFVLPNRRSITFLKKHFCDIASEGRRTIILPRMISVSDFYQSASPLAPADRTELLVTLYDCYTRLRPNAETLDDFVYWGDVLLSDFGDVDRSMVEAKAVFANLRDLGQMKDDFDYATVEQRRAIETLRGNFTSEGWIKRGEGDAKKDFLSLWELLYPLYLSFREALLGQGRCYGGMMYRDVAERMADEGAAAVLSRAFPDISRYVFTGLNAITASEDSVLRRMIAADLAECCWDFSGPILSDPDNGPCRFMASHIAKYGNALPAAASDHRPGVHVVSVPSASGQAKLLPQIVSSVDPSQTGIDFAVVLADETMLQPVLCSIPDTVDKVNVTMGYPLHESEWSSLMNDVLSLQQRVRCDASGRRSFYHKCIRDILSSGIVRGVMSEQESAKAAEVLAKAKIYVAPEEFAGGGNVLDAIFRPVLDGRQEADAAMTDALADYLLDLIMALGAAMGEDALLQKQFALQYYSCVNRLKGFHLAVQPRTWCHLLDRLAAGISVPFEGEPLGGMQVMGPLETRALDFRNVVILNAGEGSFPRRSVTPSFIPGNLRVAFGLPTYTDQDEMWTYYFYRLISRAENVWMLYDSRTEGLNTGEESRFVKQLRYVYADKCRLEESVAVSRVCSAPLEAFIGKTPEDIAVLDRKSLSASSVEQYLGCPVSFYYGFVKGLRAEDEVTESLDPGLMGTVCHDTLQALYSPDPEAAMASDADFDKMEGEDEWPEEYRVALTTIERWINRPDEVKRKVDSLIRAKLKCPQVTGRDLVTAEVAAKYVLQVLRSDAALLRASHSDSLLVYALERKVKGTICGRPFIGYVDRIDSLDGHHVRVVDYKTGSDRPEVLDGSVPPAKIFSKSEAHRTKAALQFYIYDTLLRQSGRFAPGFTIVNSMYAMSDMFSAPVAVYPERDAAFAQGLEHELGSMLAEMADPDKPFKRNDGEKTCRWCDFRVLCGKKYKG